MEKIVIGNLKMNLEENEVDNYLKIINENKFNNIQLFLAPSFIYLDKFKSNNYNLTAQDVSLYDNGEYTGEVSASQLKSIGVNSVIIGHSERRKLFNETSDIINKKIKKSISENLKVILCVGEEEKDSNENSLNYILDELKRDLDGIKEYSNIIIAYEPVYAISSGIQVNINSINYIISKIKENYNNILVVYGGSVSEKNIVEIVKYSDGVIVGKMSVKAEEFINMIEKL